MAFIFKDKHTPFNFLITNSLKCEFCFYEIYFDFKFACFINICQLLFKTFNLC